ncbi:MAG: response regulator transcription factor [Proteobacteria bacterium]|nr:response regulator transcription factor [Pseudomonadota bacterium]
MKKTILIIDDDEKLNCLLKDYLGNYGFSVQSATHPDEGMKKIKTLQPQLIILDIMLPGMNGFEVCKQIRRSHTTPILMLTARGEVTDRIVGLELGADDYLAKPFEPRELVARIQSILRRTENSTVTSKRWFGPLFIDFQKRTVLLNNEPVDLTTTEFQALSLLANNAGVVMSRDQIMDALRGIEYEAFNRSVDVVMSRLRSKLLDDPKSPSFIKTVWGTGYVFIVEESEYGK